MSERAPVRALIVEDEPHARASLREYAAGVSWLDLIGEAADGHQALALIEALRPELVFLDVSLPELSGLELIARLRYLPELVFTTAYDQYALAAFEAGALDYLLKPFGRGRFQAMLERVRRRLAIDAAAGVAGSAERAKSVMTPPVRRLFARKAETIVPIDVRSIRRAQASGDYVEVFCEAGSYLLHLGLGELAGLLDPAIFRQIHRSHLINLDAVELMRPFDARRLLVQLHGGVQIVASRAASEQLRGLVR